MADNRPHPIRDKVKTVGGALSALTGLIAWGGTYGFLTATQTAATSALVALVPGVLAAVGAVLTSFGVGKSAEPLVTPLSDPRVERVQDGMLQLVPLVPKPATGGSLDSSTF